MTPPENPVGSGPAPMPRKPTAALVTPTYAADFERCSLLCETVDRYVSGVERHYLPVAGHDVALFRALETPTRIVVDERDILPSWLHCLPDPTSLFRRRIWLSTRTVPLRGWHVQQFRIIALASTVPEDTLVHCDSDVAFVRPFDPASFWRDDRLRLYRHDDALPVEAGSGHAQWAAHAGRVLGLERAAALTHDYISTVIAWRRDTALAMIDHIESLHGRHWLQVLGSSRNISECLIYGRYVDELLHCAGHFHDSTPLCHVYWTGPRLDETGLRAFVDAMAPEQVAIGIQSFTNTDMTPLRRMLAQAG